MLPCSGLVSPQCTGGPPVVVQKGGFSTIHQSDSVFWRLIPLNCINAVCAVVVTGDDNSANKFFGAFILKVFLALLVQRVPKGQQYGS